MQKYRNAEIQKCRKTEIQKENKTENRNTKEKQDRKTERHTDIQKDKTYRKPERHKHRNEQVTATRKQHITKYKQKIRNEPGQKMLSVHELLRGLSPSAARARTVAMAVWLNLVTSFQSHGVPILLRLKLVKKIQCSESSEKRTIEVARFLMKQLD
jgi:hypothetical protein